MGGETGRREAGTNHSLPGGRHLDFSRLGNVALSVYPCCEGSLEIASVAKKVPVSDCSAGTVDEDGTDEALAGATAMQHVTHAGA